MNWNEILLTILTGISGVIGTILIKLMNNYIQKLALNAEKIKNEQERALYENALHDLNNIVDKTVTSTEQLVAKDLREKSKVDETLKEELVNIGVDAFNNIVSNLSDGTKTALSKNMVDYEDFIKKSIETKVFQLKSTN